MVERSGYRDTRRSRRSTRNARAGALFLTLGTLLMVGNLGKAAAGLPRLLASICVDALGTPAVAALATLRFLQAIAFHPAALLPLAYGILVLFFALAGILAGLVLLRNRSVGNV